MRIQHTSIVHLPTVGVRAHRLTLTRRPGICQLRPAPVVVQPGRPVDHLPEANGNGGWSLLTLAFLVLLIVGSLAFTGARL